MAIWRPTRRTARRPSSRGPSTARRPVEASFGGANITLPSDGGRDPVSLHAPRCRGGGALTDWPAEASRRCNYPTAPSRPRRPRTRRAPSRRSSRRSAREAPVTRVRALIRARGARRGAVRRGCGGRARLLHNGGREGLVGELLLEHLAYRRLHLHLQLGHRQLSRAGLALPAVLALALARRELLLRGAGLMV